MSSAASRTDGGGASRRTRTQAERTQETRAKLIAAAVREFAARGYDGTSIRHIADASGMSTASLYVHFRSKEDALYAITKPGHERTLELLDAAVAEQGDPAAQLRHFVVDFVRSQALAQEQASVVTRELRSLSPDHLEEILVLRRRVGDTLERVILAGIEAGQFEVSDPHMAALAVQSLAVDVARWFNPQGSWTADDVAREYGAMALGLLGYRGAG